MKMTYIFIVATAIFSYLGFNNRELFDKYKFNAYMVYHRKEWYRLLSHGFLHADWTHLFVNMLVLFFFGRHVENYLDLLESHGIIKFSKLFFVILYITAIAFSSSLSLVKHKDNHWYNSIGASGAVSAVLFMSIFFGPWNFIYVFLALPIPGFIYGVLYLIYSQYMSRRGGDNIGHDAHFIGAVYGFFYPLIIGAPFHIFYNQLLNPTF